VPPEPPPMRIIWIVPKFPLGAPDGARHATCSLVRSLVQGGADVDMVCLERLRDRITPAGDAQFLWARPRPLFRPGPSRPCPTSAPPWTRERTREHVACLAPSGAPRGKLGHDPDDPHGRRLRRHGGLLHGIRRQDQTAEQVRV